MKHNLIAIIFGAICLSFLLSSCEKEVQLPAQSTPKLVVESYISPQQTSIIVRLSISRPYYGVQPKVDPSIGRVNDATVTISNGSSAPVIIPWDGTQKQYILPNAQTALPITPGTTYRLQVTTPGWPTISAQTYIPQPITGANFELLGVEKNIEQNTNNPYDLFNYQFSVPSAPTSGVYYRFYPTLQVAGNVLTAPSNDASASFVYGDPYLQEYTPAFTGPSMRRLGLTKGYRSSAAPVSGTILTHAGHFISCSKDYYLFYKTASVNLGIDPKKSAVEDNIYSNISGGYGIFAGYNDVTITMNSTY